MLRDSVVNVLKARMAQSPVLKLRRAEPAPPRADRACLALSPSPHGCSHALCRWPLCLFSLPPLLHSPAFPHSLLFPLPLPQLQARPRSNAMAVDPRQVVAGFLTLSMFVMLGNMIKHDHFSSSTEVCCSEDLPFSLSRFPFPGRSDGRSLPLLDLAVRKQVPCENHSHVSFANL